MQTLGQGHSLLGFYHRFLRLSLRFLLMFMDFPSTFNFITQASELSCGFLLLGYFSRFFNLLGLFLIFFICLKIFDFFGGHTPRLHSRAVPPKLDAFEPPPSKPSPHSKGSGSEDKKDDNFDVEDEMFDVMSLRKLVKVERQRYNSACPKIEKERGAAASAAEEAMAMILRLQNEKSSVEIQAKPVPENGGAEGRV
ncbi:hypothetical protein RJT34_12452 [Clitoria ternatea]|uniref:GTD-binding domain-containing protein n=1 Tax=Clitoria ternatea TaxID=43366 RepID=A0AAN9JLT1_CLITE